MVRDMVLPDEATVENSMRGRILVMKLRGSAETVSDEEKDSAIAIVVGETKLGRANVETRRILGNHRLSSSSAGASSGRRRRSTHELLIRSLLAIPLAPMSKGFIGSGRARKGFVT